MAVKMSSSNGNKYVGYTRILLGVMYFHSKALGIINFTYDPKTKTVKVSRKLFWYGIFLCFLVAFVLATLIGMSVQKSDRWVGVFGENKILLMVQAFNGTVFLFAVSYTFLYLLISSSEFVKLVNLVLNTNYGYFEKYTSEKEQKIIFVYCLLKYLTALYFVSLNFVLYYFNESGLFSFIILISSTCVINVLQCTMAMVFVSIAVCTKFYKILRNQLHELLEDISRSYKMCYLKELNQRIDNLSMMFKRVYYIQTYGFGIHQFQISSILVTNYISSIVRAYQFYCYFFATNYSLLRIFIVSTTLLAYCFDMFFFLNVCDENVEAWKDSRKILRSFCYSGVDEQMERNVSIF